MNKKKKLTITPDALNLSFRMHILNLIEIGITESLLGREFDRNKLICKISPEEMTDDENFFYQAGKYVLDHVLNKIQDHFSFDPDEDYIDYNTEDNSIIIDTVRTNLKTQFRLFLDK